MEQNEIIAIEEKGEEICEFCCGEGEVTTDVYDEDSHQYQPVGTSKCICQIDV